MNNMCFFLRYCTHNFDIKSYFCANNAFMKKPLCTLLFLISVIIASGQDLRTAPQYFTAMFYNCENAFDTIHDEGKDDYEFLPSGTRHWSRYRFFQKLKGIGKVIAAADERRVVDLVGLCEVENDTVLTYLTRNTSLARLGYKYVMTESDDPRGVDVALLYSPFMFHLIGHESIRPDYKGTPTRDILHATGVTFTNDTLDVYVVHLPSRQNGYEGERKGMQVAQGLKQHIDSVMMVRSCPSVIVMGDFNAEIGEPVLKRSLGAVPAFGKKEQSRERDAATLYDAAKLYDVVANRKVESYKYHGKWSTIDHILVSGNLLNKETGGSLPSSSASVQGKCTNIYTDMENSGVYNHPFLLENDATYGGIKPFRTFVGWKYNKGFSDHLPVFARFLLKTTSK